MNKTLHDLVKACRPYISKRTKFLHWDGPYEKKHDTIPLFENLCLSLALMRLKEKDAYLEGKELYDRLLAFQIDGKFPYHLHTFPHCNKSYNLDTQHFDPTPHLPYWSPFHHYLKDGMECFQEGFAPKKSLLDQTLAYLHNLPTPLSPEYLPLALIEGTPLHLISSVPQPTWIETVHNHTLFWKREKIDTLALFSEGSVLRSDNTFTLSLPEGEVQDSKESCFYVNRDIHPRFISQGKQVTAFTLEHPLHVLTDTLDFTLTFDPVPPNQFYGHISLANRPTQLLKDGEIYDAAIAIRTIRRNEPMEIRCHLQILL